VETDTQTVRGRLAALEGEAEALRVETEGKAKGRERYQQKLDELFNVIAALRAEEAALEAEHTTASKSLEELQTLERDIAGDRDSRLRQIQDCSDRNQELMEKIVTHEHRLTALRSTQTAQTEHLKRITAARLELEKQRVETDKAARERNTELLNMERECSVLEQKRAEAGMEEKQILDRLWESYELTYDSAQPQRMELESPARAARQIAEYKGQISALGNVNIGAIEEYKRVKERYDYLTEQRDDVEKSRSELEGIISDITGEMKKIFKVQFDRINTAFAQTFQELFGGGTARLELEDENDLLNCGIEIKVQPPGKVLKTLTLLSGGERAFVAIALYFAFLKVRPTPFVVMDEIEAALDDNNVTRFASYMRSMCGKTQFIVITHRRGTMEEADVLYGVTMQEQGISRILTIDLNEAERSIGVR
jgi:chromosome segregation protein